MSRCNSVTWSLLDPLVPASGFSLADLKKQVEDALHEGVLTLQDKLALKLYDVSSRYLEKVSNYLRDCPLPDVSGTVSWTGRSLLHYAVLLDGVHNVQKILTAGIDVDIRDLNGDTPLMLAATEGFTSIVKVLLEAKADVHAVDNYGVSPFMAAVVGGHVHTALALLRVDADVDASVRGVSPLMVAVSRDDLDMVVVILHSNSGFDEDTNREILSLAKDKAHAVVNELLDMYIRCDQGCYEWTLFLWALHTHPESFPLLLECYHHGMERRHLPFAKAVEWQYLPALEALLHAGADINETNKKGETALMRSVAATGICEGVVRWLLSANADPNKQTVSGHTALMMACVADPLDTDDPALMVRILLDAKANVHLRNEDGATALMSAAEGTIPAVVGLLLDANADLHAVRATGSTALHDAIELGESMEMRPVMVTLLLNAKADVNARDGKGRTPLMYAADNDDCDMIHLLLAHGADLHAKDNDGHTALVWTALKSCDEAAQLLIEAKACPRDVSPAVSTLAQRFPGYRDGVAMLSGIRPCMSRKAEEGEATVAWAASIGRDDVVRLLADLGSCTPVWLNKAVVAGRRDVVRSLVAVTYNGNWMCEKHMTALMWAVHFGRIDIVRDLLAHPNTVLITATDRWSTPLSSERTHARFRLYASPVGYACGKNALMVAAGDGRVDALRVLLDAKAAVDAVDDYGDTALMWAARACRLDAMLVLLDAGANVNAKALSGDTALMDAAYYGKTDVVKVLVEANARLDAVNKDGRTALMWAAAHGHAEVVKVITSAKLKKYADAAAMYGFSLMPQPSHNVDDA